MYSICISDRLNSQIYMQRYICTKNSFSFLTLQVKMGRKKEKRHGDPQRGQVMDGECVCMRVGEGFPSGSHGG